MKHILAMLCQFFFLSLLLKHINADGVISFDESQSSCCLDKYHCCPKGTTCDSENRKCIVLMPPVKMNSDSLSTNQLFYLKPSKINSLFEKEKLGKRCSNNKFKCSGYKKCCDMESGKFGCCGFAKGVCCADLKTCCPHGTTCDVKNNSCTSKSSSLLPLMGDNKIEELKLTTICPDKKMNCETFETCCPVGYNSYGCCPFKNATCCSDQASCCPHKKKCDLKKKVCVPEIEMIYHVEKPKSLISYFNNIGLTTVCLDNTRCDVNETCCLVEEGRYGCCPFAFGVCCSDKKSCCNQGYKCVENGCKRNVN